MLSSGCERMVSLGITSYYSFPVEVYDTTTSNYNSNYPPNLLGVVAPGATLKTNIVANGGLAFYRFTVNRVDGKIIKKIMEPTETIEKNGTLIVGK